MTTDTNVQNPQATANGKNDALAFISPEKIKDAVFGNPRKSIDPKELEELKSAIAAAGYIHTPIWVRPVVGSTEEFEIIAGNRRLSCARSLQLQLVPVLIKHGLTDQQAFELSLSENADRASMTLLDEAEALKTVVTQCGGDIQAAASRMGWSESKFRKAIQLLKATRKVLALVGVKNPNGFTLTEAHASQLSLITPTVQDRLVDAVIHERMTVAKLNQSLKSQIKLPISKAVFCTQECQSCEYNASQQAALLPSLEFDADTCTNPLCYQTKTQAYFEEKSQAMSEEYGKVVLKSTVEGSMTVTESMVGTEQFAACRRCDKLCAILNDKTEVGQGQIVESQCIKLPCLKEKAQAHMQANQANTTTVEGNDNQEPETTSASGNKGKATKATINGKKTKATCDSEVTAPKRCIVSAQAAVRAVAAQQLENNPVYSLALTVSALHSTLGKGSVERCLEPLIGKTAKQLETMHREAIYELTHTYQSQHSNNMERMVIQCGNKLVSDFSGIVQQQWKPTKENLTEMTKQLRLIMLEESGFAAAYKQATTDKEFHALTTANTESQISKILKFDFNWEHYAPSFHVNAVKKQQYF